MEEATSDRFLTSGGVIAGFILATLTFVTGTVVFYALDLTLTGTMMLTLGAGALAVWLVGAIYVSRAR